VQTPPLIGVRARAPYLHDGCALVMQGFVVPRALTLFDRFDPACRAAYHGNSLALSKDEIAQVVAYLETL